MKPLDIAIELVGGVSNLADLIGVGQSVVSNWRARGTVIDPLLCTAIERVTDGKVTREDLRPTDWQAIWPELALHSVEQADNPPIRANDLIAIEDATRRRNGGIRAAKADTRKIRS